jgi:hypothetical protein
MEAAGSSETSMHIHIPQDGYLHLLFFFKWVF